MKRLLLALLFLLGAHFPSISNAHALDPGYLNLASLGGELWRITWRKPDVGSQPMAIEARLPANCMYDPPPSPTFDGRAWTTVWIANCPGGLRGGEIEITGLDQTRTETLVRYELEPGKTQVHRLTSTEIAFTVPEEPGVSDILSSYVALGVTHILEGLDHLLFVFALLLLIRQYARLFWAVTAFTLAHSITLVASTLGWLNVPSPPVEAVIALSIVFLAYELSLTPEARDPLATRAPWIVSFTFGLVHGLGFAGALREIGLPEGDIPLALFAFNIGVEIGQILFIVVVLAAGYSIRLAYPAIKNRATDFQRWTSYAIGSVAAFWVIERVAGF
jgi:hydrogenase/urease accessory protein HupE